MAKEVTVEIKLDADLKVAAEKIFNRMELSFDEAVAAFAKETVKQNRVPFYVQPKKKSAFGSLSKFANKRLMTFEAKAWERAVVEKYGKNFG